MDTDLALVLGLIIAAFSVPAILSALSDGRSPRAAMVTILIAGALVLYAIATKPGGYALADLPDAFFGVVARFMP